MAAIGLLLGTQTSKGGHTLAHEAPQPFALRKSRDGSDMRSPMIATFHDIVRDCDIVLVPRSSRTVDPEDLKTMAEVLTAQERTPRSYNSSRP